MKNIRHGKVDTKTTKNIRHGKVDTKTMKNIRHGKVDTKTMKNIRHGKVDTKTMKKISDTVKLIPKHPGNADLNYLLIIALKKMNSVMTALQNSFG